jgi:hypothetical protein
VPALFFPQDRDSLAASATVSFRLSRSARTTLQIFSRSGAYVKTAWANRALGAGTWSWKWTGWSGKGEMVPTGWYYARLITESSISKTVQTRLVLLNAYTITPSTTTPAGGTTLTVTLRTAERLAAAPRVAFTQNGRAAVTKTATSLGGNTYRVTFAVVAGATGPAKIAVSGRDAGGRSHAQATTVTVR